MNLTAKYAQGIWMTVANTIPVTFKLWRPDTVGGQWSEILFCLCGGLLSATITGTISALSVNSQSPAGKFITRLDQLREYIQARQISHSRLGQYLLRGYYLKYQGKIFDEEKILSELNPWLRQEILLFGCEHILKKVPFFQRDEDDGRNELLFRTIAELLDRKSFAPGECIFQQDESGDEMFFLVEGQVCVEQDSQLVGYLNEGTYFGELSMFADIQRTATLTAVTACQCRALRRHQLLKLIEDFPDISVKLVDYYYEKVTAIAAELREIEEENEAEYELNNGEDVYLQNSSTNQDGENIIEEEEDVIVD
ncbi:Potassium voltage-gated channel sub H member 7 [Rhizoclosmatium sp. JEL0117]|nr:Potassium voltage-gated channel sub H member 7 [Rhizoclosmatium sp. JEL0117]